MANHVLFLSPLIEDDYVYEAVMRQAQGHCLRRGQSNEVYVYQFLSQDTIDRA